MLGFYQGRTHMSSLLLAILAAGALSAPQGGALQAATPQGGTPSTPTGTTVMTDNPFGHPSTLPYRLPPFDKIKDSDYVPAFEAGMREQRAEVAAIARNPQAPDFENTIVAMERSGQLLERVSTVFSNLNVSNTDPQMDKIDTEMAPRITAHEDSILLDPALFARVDSVYRRRESLKLDPESLQLLERYHVMFVRAGAKLSEADKARLRALNEQISSLMTQFKQNVLKASKEGAVVVDSLAELDGLTEEEIGAAERSAAARKLGHSVTEHDESTFIGATQESGAARKDL
jgi:peptidyl-dipeptidase Dcp